MIALGASVASFAIVIGTSPAVTASFAIAIAVVCLVMQLSRNSESR
jgi:hypothetical protein